MIEAKNKRLQPKFDFINKINQLEEEIHMIVNNDRLKNHKDYQKISQIGLPGRWD